MAGRRARSREENVSKSAPAAKTGRDRTGGGGSVGWGLDADPEEDIFVRRVLFSVLVVAVVSVCGWFLITTVHSSGPGRLELAAEDEGTGVWAVRLLDFPASRRPTVMAMAATEIMTQLADGHPFACHELEGGRMCLCVGRSEGKDSPGLRALLERFQAYTEEQGDKPFVAASIHRCAK